MNDKKYIVALDQGTTSSRAIVFDADANRISVSQKEFTQHFPQPGWVEHDGEELFLCQLAALKEAVNTARIRADQIAALGITNQRETVILWEKATGKPLCRAIVWQCRRTAQMAEFYNKEHGALIRQKTGLVSDPYFSATKIKWLLDNIPGAKEKARRGEILCGTIDTWLVWNLTGGAAHITDYTNASRTMLFNIHTLEWDDELLELFGIPKTMLPSVHDSSCVYGTTSAKICGFEVPIASCIGDQQASLFGQACFEPGSVKTTYGTGCFMLMNTGATPVQSKNNLLTTIAIALGGQVQYALEGSVFMGGASIKWLRDQLGIISTARECDTLAASVPDTNGAILVPAFTGLGTPYWDPYARGLLIGLTRGVTKAHICRATLESICFQTKDVLLCMMDDAQSQIKEIKVDGGACVSDIMLQFQSDITGIAVYRPEDIETTALGAAFCAGLATNFWKDTEELKMRQKTQRIFTPDMEKEKSDRLYKNWLKAVERSRAWIQEE